MSHMAKGLDGVLDRFESVICEPNPYQIYLKPELNPTRCCSFSVILLPFIWPYPYGDQMPFVFTEQSLLLGSDL